jgi:putative transposase
VDTVYSIFNKYDDIYTYFIGLCSLKVKPIAFNILIAFMFKRNRTSSKYIYYYALKLYFSGLSLRKTSEHLSAFIKRNHVSIWNWIQRYNKPSKISQKRKKVLSEFIIDETLLKVRNEFVWLWIAIEPIDKIILGIRISFKRTMLVAERFLQQELVRKYGKHPVSTDGSGTWYLSTGL